MTLGDFFLKLACDASLRDRFAESAEEAARAEGLDERQLALLRTGSLRELRVTIDAELVVGDESLVIQTICAPTICVPTICDPTPPPPDSSDPAE